MNKKGQARMPSSFGGLVQYYSEYKSKIKIKPRTVVFIGIAIVIVVTLARMLLS
ncbi:preprotein translocase subunit Sec61beta [Candidatus Parvarchaeota archaeon]|jgi:Sec61beta family.|uniref:Preprotein translocase subunit Sec61beta n=1 Tax=Candidatus Acidifodinimicrobium mancum TaxID=2898728 RepID=A0A8T3UUZ5_9ARCH|nr:preprotein translocase subunit Sec61beta [Candidatus Acidifodinimicrobium mancum]